MSELRNRDRVSIYHWAKKRELDFSLGRPLPLLYTVQPVPCVILSLGFISPGRSFSSERSSPRFMQTGLAHVSFGAGSQHTISHPSAYSRMREMVSGAGRFEIRREKQLRPPRGQGAKGFCTPTADVVRNPKPNTAAQAPQKWTVASKFG